MTPVERLALIVEAGRYAEGEIHDISKFLMVSRDFGESDDPHDHAIAEKAEKILNAFIHRKRMGIPVTFKKLRWEFKIDPQE
jgi:hypothetical protein